MKNILVYSFLAILCSCRSIDINDNSFRIDKSHIKSQDVLNNKTEVLEFILEFNDWYVKTNNGLSFYEGRWGMKGYKKSISDEIRINYIKSTMIPEIRNSSFLSDSYKENIEKTITCSKDPQNLGFILLDNGRCEWNTTGQEISNIIYFYNFRTAPYKSFIDIEDKVYFEDDNKSKEILLYSTIIDKDIAIFFLPMYSILGYNSNTVLRFKLTRQNDILKIDEIINIYVPNDDIWFEVD